MQSCATQQCCRSAHLEVPPRQLRYPQPTSSGNHVPPFRLDAPVHPHALPRPRQRTSPPHLCSSCQPTPAHTGARHVHPLPVAVPVRLVGRHECHLLLNQQAPPGRDGRVLVVHGADHRGVLGPVRLLAHQRAPTAAHAPSTSARGALALRSAAATTPARVCVHMCVCVCVWLYGRYDIVGWCTAPGMLTTWNLGREEVRCAQAIPDPPGQRRSAERNCSRSTQGDSAVPSCAPSCAAPYAAAQSVCPAAPTARAVGRACMRVARHATRVVCCVACACHTHALRSTRSERTTALRRTRASCRAPSIRRTP